MKNHNSAKSVFLWLYYKSLKYFVQHNSSFHWPPYIQISLAIYGKSWLIKSVVKFNVIIIDFENCTAGLFVIVSWISFLIPMDVIPGRMALLVTLFLVLVNIFNTVTTNTPKAMNECRVQCRRHATKVVVDIDSILISAIAHLIEEQSLFMTHFLSIQCYTAIFYLNSRGVFF